MKTTKRKTLTAKERDTIKKVITGQADPNAKKHQKVLERPHVALTLEIILDQNNLSDDKLVQKLSEIVHRNPVEVKKGDQIISSNQTTTDANAHNVIRTIFQLRGKFTEKHDHTVHGDLAQASDEHLDRLISQGSRFLALGKAKLHDN